MNSISLTNVPIPGAGIDLEQRPGVPMETEPTPAGNAHWTTPEPQQATATVLKRTTLDDLTPVFSNAIPPRLLSGVVRRLAYQVPEHRATHWLLLLLGDRIDVIEHRVVRALPIAVPAIAATAAIAFLGMRRRARRRSFLARVFT